MLRRMFVLDRSRAIARPRIFMKDTVYTTDVIGNATPMTPPDFGGSVGFGEISD